jgi:hypothetical protein
MDVTNLVYNRLEIRFNGELILGTSIGREKPKNHAELMALLQEILDYTNSPGVDDKELF